MTRLHFQWQNSTISQLPGTRLRQHRGPAEKSDAILKALKERVNSPISVTKSQPGPATFFETGFLDNKDFGHEDTAYGRQKAGLSEALILHIQALLRQFYQMNVHFTSSARGPLLRMVGIWEKMK
jgi:hypothetical protein